MKKITALLLLLCVALAPFTGLAESVFTYPGLGEATVQSGLRGDMPLFLGIALFSALFVFCGNLVANILYAVVDPQIREGGRHK